MKAEELRIGNWYSSGIDMETGEQVHNQVVPDLYMNWHVNGCWAEPIPLTEEWLERFGFEQMKLYTGDNCFVKEKFCVLCDGELKNYDLRLTFDSDQTIRVKLDYVHQLQNLYFALTGEELNQNKDDESNTTTTVD
jgi:hypothetical protein